MDNILKNNQNNQDFSDEYAEALETVPPEVRAFMWSDAFNLLLKNISEAYKFSSNQYDVLRDVVMKTLVGTITPVSRRGALSEAGINNEVQDQVLQTINEEIVSRALTQIEEYKYLNEETVSGEISSDQNDAPSPIQALEAIKQRLSQNTVIASSTRDLSSEKVKEDIKSSSIQNITKPQIDPYRELPDKE